MIKAGIVGGLSQSAGELIRILINHPDVDLIRVTEPELAGLPVSAHHKGLIGENYMRFSSEVATDDVDILFLCPSEEGESLHFVGGNTLPESLCIVDMSADFRNHIGDGWVYGLPELNRKPLVRGARRASVPGAMAHAVLLALLPLAAEGLLNADLHINVTTSSEDAEAGQPLAFLDHEEVDEIRNSIRVLQPDFDRDILFLAQASGWERGTVATVYFRTPEPLERIRALFEEMYRDHNFTYLTDSLPDLREVTGTNKAVIHLEKVGNRLVITSMIDNAVKGGAGTAVHDMNLLFGLQERVGLMLKSV